MGSPVNSGRVAVVLGPRGLANVEGSPLAGVPGVGVVTWPFNGVALAPSSTQIREVLGGAEAVVFDPWSPGCVFNDELWAAAPGLRVVAGTFDNRFEGWIDIADAAQRGVTVIDTSRSM